MQTRRDIIRGGLGLAGIIASGKAPAAVVKSMLSTRKEIVAGGGDEMLSAKSYVQDGLVAMWDGIENAGWGVHDPNATVWKDLVGDRDITLHGANINADCVFIPKSGWGNANFPQSYGCIEVVLVKSVATTNRANNSVITIGPTYGGYGLCVNKSNKLMDTYDSARGPVININGEELFSASFNKNGPTTTSVYKNGSARNDGYVAAGDRYNGKGASDVINQDPISNPGSEKSERNSDLWYRSIRIYSRALTADEIAANYAIDKARFNLP